MSVGFNSDINTYSPQTQNNMMRVSTSNAPELINKPIEKVQNVISNTVDTFVKEPQDEEKKKSHKAAITAGSSVLVLTALIALLNPQFSSKYVNKLKGMANKASANVKTNKDDVVKSKFYKASEKVLQSIVDFFQFTNTVNATKDIGFKWLCQSEKFNGVKNERAKKILKKCDSGFRKIMTPVHNSISNWFDDLSKSTVYKHYKNTRNKFNTLDVMMETYKKKLSPAEQKAFEQKLAEIKSVRGYFAKDKVGERLAVQEKSMSNLERDFNDKLINGYLKKFEGIKSKGSFQDKMNHNTKLIKDNMSFWAEDIMMPTRDKLEQNGAKIVDDLIGDGKGVKGKYNELIDILAPHISSEEKSILEDALNKAGKKLRKANKSECVEYFDKKRDLVLGGAPTDILTGIGMVGMSGVAVSTADTRQERVSRALTLGFPAIAGIGTSMAMTAMLFSGVQGMIYGSLASVGLSKLGSETDKLLNPKKDTALAQNKQQNKQAEVKNA